MIGFAKSFQPGVENGNRKHVACAGISAVKITAKEEEKKDYVGKRSFC
jgi:hypothetical protein